MCGALIFSTYLQKSCKYVGCYGYMLYSSPFQSVNILTA
uniref:Uncharacterized protein n=1 Tax=Anguilla anguilla TaxID=7936 RepID=A0A0E9P823_ANGAN